MHYITGWIVLSIGSPLHYYAHSAKKPQSLTSVNLLPSTIMSHCINNLAKDWNERGHAMT
jgi:hypothetical protein